MLIMLISSNVLIAGELGMEPCSLICVLKIYLFPYAGVGGHAKMFFNPLFIHKKSLGS